MGVMNHVAVEIARGEIGNKPDKGKRVTGDAMEKYLSTVGIYRDGGGYDYCGAFINYCFQSASWLLGRSNPLDDYSVNREKHVARSISVLYRFGRDMGLLANTPQVGDIYIESDKDHGGIIELVNPSEKTVATIEGNTWVGNDSNWGVHRRKARKVEGAFFLRLL